MKNGLLVLADDFTGALDTGIQFVKNGVRTKVISELVPGQEICFSDIDADVLVINTDSRHLTPEAAGAAIAGIVRKASEAGIRRFFKKTDSALRGNIGAELEAVLTASGAKSIQFLPSFPKMNRCVSGGILKIDGAPVTQSSFGRDPFEPVKQDRVADILAEQTGLPVSLRDSADQDAGGIVVYNAETDADMERIVSGLDLSGDKAVSAAAGCAGLAAFMPAALGLQGRAPELPECDRGFLVICGSVNSITVGQVAEAEKAGFVHERIPLEDKVTDRLKTAAGEETLSRYAELVRENDRVVIDSNDVPGTYGVLDWAKDNGVSAKEIGSRIAGVLGHIVTRLVSGGIRRTMLLTGGDVLLASMREMGVTELSPIAEVSPGVVLSSFETGGKKLNVISKSGGFGSPDLMVRLGEKFS